MFPKCFISYCWSNSKDAIDKGSRHIEGAIDGADPRHLKTYLEKEGVECWMDIEQVGRNGLFKDITDGLKKAKVVVACISNEVPKQLKFHSTHFIYIHRECNKQVTNIYFRFLS